MKKYPLCETVSLSQKGWANLQKVMELEKLTFKVS